MYMSRGSIMRHGTIIDIFFAAFYDCARRFRRRANPISIQNTPAKRGMRRMISHPGFGSSRRLFVDHALLFHGELINVTNYCILSLV